MRNHSFRYCMLIGAAALAGVAIYYFITYVEIAIALNNNGLVQHLKDSIRALWLAFAVQALLIALLYTVVAYKPHSVTREVIVICGLLQLTESVLLFMLAGKATAAILLAVAAFFILIGSMIWPKVLPPQSAVQPAVQPEPEPLP
jgi:hypothetical protein